MDTQHINNNNNGVPLADTNRSGFDPNSNGPAKTEISESKKFDSLGCAIEEGVEKISLLGNGNGASGTCVRKIEENGHVLEIEGEGEGEGEGKSESESESESEEPESATSSSSSSSSSSGESSSGESDSDDDDDDEKEEEEEKGEEGPAQGDADVEVEEGEIEGSDDDDDGDKMVSWSMDDDGDDNEEEADTGGGGGPIRSKNELEDLPPVPPVNVTLEPHHQMLPVGVVMSILGAKVIVEGVEKHNPLSEGSILWMTESRKPLGLVDEIFGPVKNPYYVVRYNSENEVPTEIQGGTLISFVSEFANHVLNNKDLYKKGYDASGANDEEVFDEVEFSDDEKEAEYRRMQRMAKRGTNDQNPGKKKNNKKKVLSKGHAVPTIPKAPAARTIPNASTASTIPNTPAAPLLDCGNFLPFSGIGQGVFGGTTAFPPFTIPPSNAGPNFATNGFWTNGTTLPQQPHSALLPNVFPTNGISWYPQNTQFSHQLPLPGIPFQQQLPPPSQGAMLPGVQPNIFAQPMYAQGLVGQNQMPFGLNTTFPQIRPPIRAAPQGFPSSELQPEGNLNLHSSTIPGAPSQFHPGASASNNNNGRKTFHGAGRGRGRKGWRPAK